LVIPPKVKGLWGQNSLGKTVEGGPPPRNRIILNEESLHLILIPWRVTYLLFPLCISDSRGAHDLNAVKSFSNLRFALHRKKARRERRLGEGYVVVAWAALPPPREPQYPSGKRCLPPIGIARILRIHIFQQWFTLSDPLARRGLYGSAAVWGFVTLIWTIRLSRTGQ
jgi:hypothetical protein